MRRSQTAVPPAPHRWTRWAMLAVTGLAACSVDQAVPESTTVDIPSEGGIIRSADGYFAVRIAAGDAQEVTIETIYGLGIEGLSSKVYEVRVARASTRASEVTYDANQLLNPYTKVLVRVDDGVPRHLPTLWDVTNNRLLSSGVDLDRRRFAVYDLGIRNGDCVNQSCGQHCLYCDDAPEGCVPQRGACDLEGVCRLPALAQCGGPEVDGWDAPPNAGHVFVIDSLAIAEAGRGMDVDGECDVTGDCLDNALSVLGPLANDAMRQSLLGGEMLTLIELAGLDAPFTGDDATVAVKFYAAVDADTPAFPANNFYILPGETTCCEFRIPPLSLSGTPPQARARAPGRVERGRLRSLAPVSLTFAVEAGVPPNPTYPMQRSLISGRVGAALQDIDEGLIGGAIPVSTLAASENRFCRQAGPRCPGVLPEGATLLDLVAALAGPPDVDLDGDGLECVLDTDGDGRIDRCCDGGVDPCGRCTSPVPPLDASLPGSCALDPRMADGYSIGLDFTAVAATVVGVGAP